VRRFIGAFDRVKNQDWKPAHNSSASQARFRSAELEPKWLTTDDA
jgi:hypothetical protein